jgi:hypothetical protein
LKKYKIKFIQKSAENFLNNLNNLWQNADSLIDFSSPWDDKSIKKIEFKSLHNNKEVFFQFKVFDEDVYIHPSTDKNESINNSDRVLPLMRYYRTNYISKSVG